MTLVPTPLGLLGVAAGIAAWAMSALVLAQGRGRSVNRRLALVLFLEGAGAATGNGLMFLTDVREDAFAVQVVATCIFLALPVAYVRFLAALDSPLARRLHHPLTAVVGGVYLVGGLAFALLRPELFTPHMVQPWYAPWDQEPAPLFLAVLIVNALAGMLALVVSVDALRRTRGVAGAARARARTFVAAFTTRDGIFLVAVTLLPWIATTFPSRFTDLGFMFAFTATLAIAAYVPILAYGILKAQLFDIDLRLKRGLSRGTIGAVFLAVFFVAAQIAQNWLSDTWGYLAGGAAAGLLLFVAAPIQQLAERVADTAMPNVRASAEYEAFRKHEVYRQAVVDAWLDGEITPRERAILDGLRRSLGIDPTVAEEMERRGAPA